MESAAPHAPPGSAGFRLGVLFLIAASVTACAGRAHPTFLPRLAPVRIGSKEVGLASWYGPRFHGNMTASGERYNMFDLTAAHRTLPFGTKVRVTDLGNGKQVVVRINDRGPFLKGRVIDLSYEAARRLDLPRTGVAKVRVEVIALPEGSGG